MRAGVPLTADYATTPCRRASPSSSPVGCGGSCMYVLEIVVLVGVIVSVVVKATIIIIIIIIIIKGL